MYRPVGGLHYWEPQLWLDRMASLVCYWTIYVMPAPWLAEAAAWWSPSLHTLLIYRGNSVYMLIPLKKSINLLPCLILYLIWVGDFKMSLYVSWIRSLELASVRRFLLMNFVWDWWIFLENWWLFLIFNEFMGYFAKYHKSDWWLKILISGTVNRFCRSSIEYRLTLVAKCFDCCFTKYVSEVKPFAMILNKKLKNI